MSRSLLWEITLAFGMILVGFNYPTLHGLRADPIAPVAPIPSPPPSAGFDSDRFTEAKVARGPPPAIDPSAASMSQIAMWGVEGIRD